MQIVGLLLTQLVGRFTVGIVRRVRRVGRVGRVGRVRRDVLKALLEGSCHVVTEG